MISYEYRDAMGQVHPGEDSTRELRMVTEQGEPIDLVVDPRDPSRSLVASRYTANSISCLLPIGAMVSVCALALLLAMVPD